MNVVIVLPTYNERENLKKLIPRIEKVFASLSDKYNPSILVVDDNSPDGTAEVVKKLASQWKNIYLLSGKKKGLGAAYVRGIEYAMEKLSADILFEMDSDLSHDPKLIPKFLREIEKGNDFVIGSRYIPGGAIPENWAFHRKLFSIIGNFIVRYGLMIPSIHEWTNGYRAFRKEVYHKISPGLSKFPGYTFQVATLHRVYQAGFKIKEIPIKFVDRSWGESKIIPPEYIYNVIRYIFLNSTFIRYLIVGGIGFGLQTVIAYLLVKINMFAGLAVTIGAEVAIISNFILNNLWTFSHKSLSGKKKVAIKFVAFQLTSIGAIIIQGATVSILTLIFGEQIWFWAMMGSIIFLVIPYNFFIYNRFIWRRKQKV